LETTTYNYLELPNALGLMPDDDGLFVGKVQGFPIGLKIIDEGESPVLLFQIRHWLTKGAPELKALNYDVCLGALLRSKAVEIELEDRFAWFTINNLQACFHLATIPDLVASVLTSFKNAGLIGDESVCHYCHKERVETLTVDGGKVAQICSSCLAERNAKAQKETPQSVAESIPIALMSPGGALVGAVLWAACWAFHDAVFDYLNVKVIPNLVVVVIAVVIGLMVGGPTGWLIKQNRRRGRVVSTIASILFGSLAVVAGEVFYITWLIFREFNVISLSAAVRVIPDFYGGAGAFFVAMRIVAAVTAVICAYEISQPKKATLNL
jgi:hypothetical protein